MVTLFGAFEVGARGLLAQQQGLNVTGHNIANANTEGFSRQRVNLATSYPLNVTPGSVGTGVRVESIQRLRDEFLDFQLREATTENGFLDANSDIFLELQTILQDPLNPLADTLENSPAESGLNGLLSRFFGAFQELAANPESIAVRATVRETAISLAEGISTVRGNLSDLRETLNNRIRDTVSEVNSLLERIGTLNEDIARIEAVSGNSANDLRDLRDQALTQLSELVPITVTPQANGSVDVRVLGTGAVIGNRVSPFEALIAPGDSSGDYQIVNSLERSRVLTNDLEGGRLGALIHARDDLVPDFINQIDTLAATVIREVNRAHSGSIGLEGFTSLTGSQDVANPATVFDSLGLPFPPQAGSFTLRVVNSEGVVQNLYSINFNPAVDSLADLAARIDAIDGVAGPGGGSISASVTTDNRLSITSNGGLEFTFQGDTSGALASLGLNTFFSGSDGSDIAVSDFILDPTEGLRRIAASATGAPGDNGGALTLAGLQNALVAGSGSTTIGDFYRQTIAELGVRAQRNASRIDASERTLNGLRDQVESVSGVSLDEEAVNLIRFQQAFNAAARYITTVDSLIDRVVNGMGVTR
ncbi:MAG: flagellar hook-associated protein FlgK [Candidatus Omnitrophica bacterium]|nr:flagellar hook-associated protein FlgK [Candidatus Omnitrophota bacterium]